tara:strand:- start:7793 stop:8686 length:894 start_codon:yes stop_codon:yes gene_type:complete
MKSGRSQGRLFIAKVKLKAFWEIGVGLDFYLGIHVAAWIDRCEVPMFISMNQLWNRKKKFQQKGRVAIDSGGFTELRLNGEWTKTALDYADKLNDLVVNRNLKIDWAAPQDWMVEPFMLERTGLSVEEHQIRTVENYIELNELTKNEEFEIIPVLQGWSMDDYFQCWEMYDSYGVDLRSVERVGVGSVCRRQSEREIGELMLNLKREGLSLHGFGVKSIGLDMYWDCLDSVDSLGWSMNARRNPDRVCVRCEMLNLNKPNCGNCLEYGIEWRSRILNKIEKGGKILRLFDYESSSEC